MRKSLIAIGLLLFMSSTSGFAACIGYAGPGGPCYTGPGGGAYTGPGGGAYTGPGGGAYTGPGGGAYTGPGGGAYTGPGGGAYTGPLEGVPMLALVGLATQARAATILTRGTAPLLIAVDNRSSRLPLTSR